MAQSLQEASCNSSTTLTLNTCPVSTGYRSFSSLQECLTALRQLQNSQDLEASTRICVFVWTSFTPSSACSFIPSCTLNAMPDRTGQGQNTNHCRRRDITLDGLSSDDRCSYGHSIRGYDPGFAPGYSGQMFIFTANANR